MDWTLEDNMVDGLFFCATLTSRRGGHTPFVQAEPETCGGGLAGTRRFLGWSLGGAGIGDENAESCGVVRPLRIPLVIRPQCAARMLLLSD